VEDRLANLRAARKRWSAGATPVTNARCRAVAVSRLLLNAITRGGEAHLPASVTGLLRAV